LPLSPPYIPLEVRRADAIAAQAFELLALKLKSPWRDGTTVIVMSRLKLMQRLAALVPRPRLHSGRI